MFWSAVDLDAGTGMHGLSSLQCWDVRCLSNGCVDSPSSRVCAHTPKPGCCVGADVTNVTCLGAPGAAGCSCAARARQPLMPPHAGSCSRTRTWSRTGRTRGARTRSPTGSRVSGPANRRASRSQKPPRWTCLRRDRTGEAAERRQRAAELRGGRGPVGMTGRPEAAGSSHWRSRRSRPAQRG